MYFSCPISECNLISLKELMHRSLAGHLCRKNKIFFHTDAAQAVGKIPLDVNELKIDLMSISGHKIYGPKGMIVLFTVNFSHNFPLQCNPTWMILYPVHTKA